jgi:preprotein translocase subunit SecF
VLLFVGGEVTRGFAFALTVGIIVGTYSSIYIASAVVLDNSLRKKKE